MAPYRWVLKIAGPKPPQTSSDSPKILGISQASSDTLARTFLESTSLRHYYFSRIICKIMQTLVFTWYFSSWMVEKAWEADLMLFWYHKWTLEAKKPINNVYNNTHSEKCRFLGVCHNPDTQPYFSFPFIHWFREDLAAPRKL
ncbi:hypothetical protein KIL84_007482 [Mauremys mutica]|uniref:Uncharacterized protein n=1 Tax=Mauremys mutica TaxID=74926 RepID=A0A9D3WXH6_9SAUR|nr:hypothetical protein KIL84_007482 [Mauremys mutica]